MFYFTASYWGVLTVKSGMSCRGVVANYTAYGCAMVCRWGSGGNVSDVGGDVGGDVGEA